MVITTAHYVSSHIVNKFHVIALHIFTFSQVFLMLSMAATHNRDDSFIHSFIHSFSQSVIWSD